MLTEPSTTALTATLCITPLITTYTLCKMLIPFYTKKGLVVKDYHKRGSPTVPRPGGPAITLSIALSETILYLYTNNTGVLAVLLTTLIAAALGLIDDFRTLGGILKPASLILGGLPILLLSAYSFRPEFPLFGPVRLPWIYPLLILMAIPITANTMNTIDVLNGVASGFSVIATAPLLLALTLKGEYTIALATLPLLVTSLTFYHFHRYPSKIFLGDSGSLTLGAMYGAIAIVGGVEVVGVVALLPAIMNSFFFLSSVRRLVEHRMVKERPTTVLEDDRLAASKAPSAPVTLVRMIVADGPLSEKDIVKQIFVLSTFAALLATLTALITWVV